MRSLILILSLLSCQCWAWEMSDVSLLIPLEQAREFLKPSQLISAAAIAGLPQPIFDREKALSFRDDIRVVGLRFDPCFFEGTGPVVCRKMIRLVWQPVVMKSGALTTRDAAIHSFYDFGDDGFGRLMDDYQELLAKYPANEGRVLAMNPRFAETGFARDLKALILKYCTLKNLSRVTVMTLGKGENDWTFQGVEVHQEQITPIQIARVNSDHQRLITLKPTGFQLRAKVTPEGHSVNAAAIFRDSRKGGDQAAFAEELAFEQDPRRSNPGTVDCASCHMSEPGAEFLRRSGRWNSTFSSTRDLSNFTLPNLQPRRFRAFGYFNSEPLIAQRTINESADVTDVLERLFPSKTH